MEAIFSDKGIHKKIDKNIQYLYFGDSTSSYDLKYQYMQMFHKIDFINEGW